MDDATGSLSNCMTAVPCQGDRTELAKQVRVLPIEVWEQIIDYCAGFSSSEFEVEPVNVLPSCALVCRSWLPRSRFHLYRYIKLSHGSDVLKFSRTLADSPGLASCVRELCAQEDEQPWIYVLPFLAPGLISLETLVLTGHMPLQADFYVLISQFTTVSQLSLVHATLHSAADFIRLVSALPNLTHLRLDNVHWPHAVYPLHLLGQLLPRRPELESLTVDQGTVDEHTLAVQWLVTTPSAQSITNLDFLCICDVPMLKALGSLIQECADGLSQLALSIDCDIPQEVKDQYSTADFERMHYLFLGMPTIDIAFLNVLISCTTSRHVIEVMVDTLSSGMTSLTRADWATVDDLLARPNFSTLNRFVITLICDTSEREFLRWREEVGHGLFRLNARGIIQYVFLGSWRY